MNTLEAARLILLYLADYAEGDPFDSLKYFFEDGNDKKTADFIAWSVDVFNKNTDKSVPYTSIDFYIGSDEDVLIGCNLLGNEFIDDEVGLSALYTLESQGYITGVVGKGGQNGFIIASITIEPCDEAAFHNETEPELEDEDLNKVETSQVNSITANESPKWTASTSIHLKENTEGPFGAFINDIVKNLSHMDAQLREEKLKNHLLRERVWELESKLTTMEKQNV